MAGEVTGKSGGSPAGGKVGAVMVLGAGISGMQSSLDLAESGFKVYLIEKSPTIGGVMAQLDKTFPTNDCSMCIMAPKLVATGRHPNIRIISNSEVTTVTGKAGDFEVTIRRHARYVDPTKCKACGTCSQNCPVTANDEYNEALKPRKAIYVKYAQAIPLVYTIDRDNCIGCGTCEGVCPAGAIKYDDKETEEVFHVGSIILSPGFGKFDALQKPEYGYGLYKNVITSLELERMLSATGPSGGVAIRPSDGDIPARVAFLQCVGSRDELVGAPYCSSVCCMYSMKEAIIAKEHAEGMDTTIFFMDIRAYGKEFEKYYNRAKDEYHIKFTRARVASIDEDPETRNLIVNYVDGNKAKKAEFDLVVLAIGYRPPEDAKRIAASMGVNLNKYGFAATSTFSPLDTNVKGIFVGGTFAGPRDIPETVANASGAAAKASEVVATERGKLVEKKVFPVEKTVSKADEPRIGVFICHCGINIGATVNVPEVVEYAKTLPNVVFADRNLYTCSQDTQEKIHLMIKEHNLNRVIVASCTPRTHEPLFQNTCREAGLNPYLFEFANIREHCSWVHMHDKAGATRKAKDLVRMATAKSRLQEPLYRSFLTVNQKGLVIGGGLSGLTAALGLAEQGFQVFLVEKEPELGGMMRRIHFLADPEEDPQKYLKTLIQKVQSHKRIKIFLGAKLKSVEGSVGDFKTIVESGGKEETIDHGIVIIAIGAQEYRPTEYLYGKNPHVMTQLELEERISKNNVEGKTFVIIQCVGARNKDWPNCSRICCTEALKNTLKLKEKVQDADVFILHKDIRSYGYHEELYRDARGKGVHFIHYDEENMPQVTEEGGKLRVELMDDILEKRVVIRPDNLILSAATRPATDTKDIAMLFKVSTTEDGFFFEAHMKLRPVEFATEGIFLAGLAHGPKLVDEAISQANAAVSRAMTILSQEKIELEAIKSFVVDEKCDGCAFCISTCPFNAITLVEYMRGGDVKKTVEVNDALCKGCGCCMATCPKEGIFVRGFSLEQLKAMVHAALEVN
jgi:heterodisulfide reductase subunit A